MNTEKALKILQVSTTDRIGGAAGDCWSLHRAWLERGHDAWIATGVKSCDDPRVMLLSPEGVRPGLARRLDARSGLSAMARLQRRVGQWMGREDFAFPATAGLLQVPPERPDVVHCHNLHGGYFDLRRLPELSAERPVVLTLHDSWLLGGHCAHPLGCARWETGCGSCPDLSIYPPVLRDGTAGNARRKRDIFARSRVYVATPCAWLMERVQRSMLAPAIVESRIIPYGVSPDLFHPGDRAQAREALGIAQDARVLLFSSFMVRNNPFRDFALLRDALLELAREWTGAPLILLALGGEGAEEQVGKATIRYLPFTDDREFVAGVYRAADLYLHAALMDTFPNAVLEALASGTPVLATAAGGIAEQVRGLVVDHPDGLNDAGADAATGHLTPIGDLAAFSRGLRVLLEDGERLAQLGRNARRDALDRFAPAREADEYESWYRKILKEWRPT